MILSADRETFRCASSSAREAASALRLGKEARLWAWRGKDRTPANAQARVVASRKEIPNVRRGFSILPLFVGQALESNGTREHGPNPRTKKGSVLLCRLHIRRVHFHHNRTHEHFKGNHHAKLVLLAHQDALRSGQRAMDDAHL